MKKLDFKKVIGSKYTVGLFSLLVGLGIGYKSNNAVADVKEKQDFKATEKEVLDTRKTEFVDTQPESTINWTNHSNNMVAKTFGELVAKEFACDIDSVNRALMTPADLYQLDYNYCTKAVTTAIQAAEERAQLKQKGKVTILADEKPMSQVCTNGDTLVSVFARNYGNLVPGAFITNPSVDTMKNVSAGAIVRYAGHTKLYMGIGFVSPDGKYFVPDVNGKPVVGSGYNDSFNYMSDDNCQVVDIQKILQYKLQVEQGRHTR